MVFFPTDNMASIVYQALCKNREARAVALDISKNLTVGLPYYLEGYNISGIMFDLIKFLLQNLF